MRNAFADTFYYLALVSEHDASHEQAVRISRDYKDRVLTTIWVLTEVADGLAARNQRHVFVALLKALKLDTNLTILPATTELFDKGCDLYGRRLDKDWSLTDCISFVAMEEHGIIEALTADRHFEQAGFKILLK